MYCLLLQPPKPRYCRTVPNINIGEHCSSVPGLVLPHWPSGQCVVVRCYGGVGGVWRRVPATDSRLQWLLLLSSPAAVCSVQQHGPARSTQRQGGIYSPAALHRHPPHPTGNTRSYQATGKHTHISHTHWSKYMIGETFWYHQKRPTVKNMLLGLRKKK